MVRKMKLSFCYLNLYREFLKKIVLIMRKIHSTESSSFNWVAGKNDTINLFREHYNRMIISINSK